MSMKDLYNSSKFAYCWAVVFLLSPWMTFVIATKTWASCQILTPSQASSIYNRDYAVIQLSLMVIYFSVIYNTSVWFWFTSTIAFVGKKICYLVKTDTSRTALFLPTTLINVGAWIFIYQNCKTVLYPWNFWWPKIRFISDV